MWKAWRHSNLEKFASHPAALPLTFHMGGNRMRAALYLRVSTGGQDLAAQENDLRQYAQHRGWGSPSTATKSRACSNFGRDWTGCGAPAEKGRLTLLSSGPLTGLPVP